jgi:hypothetical protein
MLIRFVAASSLGLFFFSGCAFPPPHYDFSSPATTTNPTRGGAVGARTVARDGKTQYGLTEFSAEQACFLVQIDGPETQRVQGFPFELRGFESEDQDLRRVPVLESSRVTVKDTSSRLQSMPSGGYNSPITDVEVCFAKPGAVITDATRFMVVSVDYDNTSEHDGVWKLTN